MTYDQHANSGNPFIQAAVTHRLWRGLLRISPLLLIAGFVLAVAGPFVILAPVPADPNGAILGILPGVFIMLAGMFGLLLWLIGSFFGWLARTAPGRTYGEAQHA